MCVGEVSVSVRVYYRMCVGVKDVLLIPRLVHERGCM